MMANHRRAPLHIKILLFSQVWAMLCFFLTMFVSAPIGIFLLIVFGSLGIGVVFLVFINTILKNLYIPSEKDF